jgi:hypothetical protein
MNLGKNNQAIVNAHQMGYKVTDDGRVLSPFTGRERILWNDKKRYRKLQTDIKGYLCFGIGKCASKVMVHRLQAYQKFGNKIFEDGIQVRHLNGNSLDNSFDNIAIGTASDNMMDKPKALRVRQASLANKKHKDVLAIRAFYRTCNSYKKTMERFNISSKGTLHFILNNAIHEKEDYNQPEFIM